MIRITVDREPLDLYEGFSLEIEDTSPIFNDVGSQTLSFALPATSRNRRILGFPARPDSVANKAPRRFRCSVDSGPYSRSGIINITGASRNEISINIGFDNAMAYEAWRSKRLAELDSLPARKFPSLYSLFNHVCRIWSEDDPRVYDLATFPICIDVDWTEKDANGWPGYFEALVPWTLWFTDGKTEVKLQRKVDGVLTEVTAPVGYGCTPFVRVWKILECVFAEIGLKPDRNPFFEDDDLARLVVLNNTADSLCTGTLDYRDLMPDCTVEEFLHSLFVRFGLVFRTDFDTGLAYIRLVREIAEDSPTLDIDAYLTGYAESEFRTPQYVTLSAGTSITGAEPYTERFEDFLRGYSVSNIQVGHAIQPEVRGISRADYVDDEDDEAWGGSHVGVLSHEPDPDDHDDKEPSEDVTDPSVEIERPKEQVKDGIHFTWDSGTGKWSRVSVLNGYRLKEESSSFFRWDPRPEGLDPLDLSSADEFCPISPLSDYEIGDEYSGSMIMPMFLNGSRHLHTYIDSIANEDKGECPLSFMFAVGGTLMGGYVSLGRLVSGSTMLYFQFKGGLYDKYWKTYDLMYRNADREVSAVCRLNKSILRKIDILKPVRLGGVPMLIDTANATITDDIIAEAQLTLIPLVDSGADPQELPDFPPVDCVL